MLLICLHSFAGRNVRINTKLTKTGTFPLGENNHLYSTEMNSELTRNWHWIDFLFSCPKSSEIITHKNRIFKSGNSQNAFDLQWIKSPPAWTRTSSRLIANRLINIEISCTFDVNILKPCTKGVKSFWYWTKLKKLYWLSTVDCPRYWCLSQTTDINFLFRKETKGFLIANWIACCAISFYAI